MISKLFDAREKLEKLSYDDFQKYLKNNQLTKEDYLNLMRVAFENKKKRPMFIPYLKLLVSYSEIILSSNLIETPLYLAICKLGTTPQVQGLTKMINYKIQTYCQQNPIYYCLANQKVNKDTNKSHRQEILKYLLTVKPQLIDWKIKKPLLLQALQKKQLDSTLILIQKGADCSLITEQDENLMHLLYKTYRKDNQKLFFEIRTLLLENGVNEKKVNKTGRKPLDYCPQITKKLEDESKQRKNQQRLVVDQTSRIKGKSEEGTHSAQKSKQQKTSNLNNNSQSHKGFVVKLDEIYERDLVSQANYVLDKSTQQKQRQFKKKKLQKQKEKDKQKKRVLTPDQLKYYLEEDIQYQLSQIQGQNQRCHELFSQLIEKIIYQLGAYHNVGVEVFGSFATALYLPESDIDLVVILKQPCLKQISAQLNRIRSGDFLEKLLPCLDQLKQEIEYIKLIKTATVPILKIQCTQKYHFKKIDITYEEQNHNGRQSVNLVKEYIEIYPQLRVVTLILKRFIYAAKLSDPYSGGLSSYGLIFMIVAFIQHTNRQRKLKAIQTPANTAEILIGFLRFYGFTHNYISRQIDVLDPVQGDAEMKTEYIDPNSHPIYSLVDAVDLNYNVASNGDWALRPRLSINDPLNKMNNVGRSTHKIREIRIIFEIAYVCILTNKQCGKKKKCQSYKRIKQNCQPDLRYIDNKRPCCILNRMFRSVDTIPFS